VREIYRTFANHRFPSDNLAEEFSWETHPEQPGAGTYRGHEAVRAYFRDWVGGWHDVQSKVERLIDRGDQVVALIHGSYRLSSEGQPIEDRYAHVWTLREGKAVHARATGRSLKNSAFKSPKSKSNHFGEPAAPRANDNLASGLRSRGSGFHGDHCRRPAPCEASAAASEIRGRRSRLGTEGWRAGSIAGHVASVKRSRI
jgi:ketosteroid isomerase-like protein